VKRLGSVFFVLMVIFITACSGTQTSSGSTSGQAEAKKASPTEIVVGGKVFTEQVLLVHLMSELLKSKTGHEVSVKEGLGSSQVLMQALTDGDIQVYADYSGTGYINILKNKLLPEDTPESIYQKTKEGYEKNYGFTWLKPLGFSNTFTLIMKPEKAQELQVKSFSDLVKHAPNLVIGSDAQFFERVDGYKGLAEKYGFQFKKNLEMDLGLAYTALAEGEIDVLVGYTTDGRIASLNLNILEDDKKYFPPYWPAPILKMDFMKQYPEVADALNELSGKLDERTMAGLNAKVDVDKKDPIVVAQEFLKEAGLIK
jgi:glycine betaine/choline ABC-type transport system substrate-binding protein